MGFLEWEEKVKACEEYHLIEVKTNGYTTIELVEINGTWTKVLKSVPASNSIKN